MKTVNEVTQDVKGMTHKVYLAGLGVAATVEDKTKKVFDNLVEKGSKTSDKLPERKKVSENPIFQRIEDAGKRTMEATRERVGNVIAGFGIPSRDEIKALTRSVEQLTEKVQKLQTKTEA